MSEGWDRMISVQESHRLIAEAVWLAAHYGHMRPPGGYEVPEAEPDPDEKPRQATYCHTCGTEPTGGLVVECEHCELKRHRAQYDEEFQAGVHKFLVQLSRVSRFTGLVVSAPYHDLMVVAADGGEMSDEDIEWDGESYLTAAQRYFRYWISAE